MTITHKGFTFTGVAEAVQFGEYERRPQYTSAFGVSGMSVIDSGRTGRPFTVRVYVYGSFSTAALLDAFLKLIDSKTGQVGTFVDSGSVARTIRDVEFCGADREQDPLPTAPDGGWIAVVNLRFMQLAPGASG